MAHGQALGVRLNPTTHPLRGISESATRGRIEQLCGFNPQEKNLGGGGGLNINNQFQSEMNVFLWSADFLLLFVNKYYEINYDKLCPNTWKMMVFRHCIRCLIFFPSENTFISVEYFDIVVTTSNIVYIFFKNFRIYRHSIRNVVRLFWPRIPFIGIIWHGGKLFPWRLNRRGYNGLY